MKKQPIEIFKEITEQLLAKADPKLSKPIRNQNFVFVPSKQDGGPEEGMFLEINNRDDKTIGYVSLGKLYAVASTSYQETSVTFAGNVGSLEGLSQLQRMAEDIKDYPALER